MQFIYFWLIFLLKKSFSDDFFSVAAISNILRVFKLIYLNFCFFYVSYLFYFFDGNKYSSWNNFYARHIARRKCPAFFCVSENWPKEFKLFLLLRSTFLVFYNEGYTILWIPIVQRYFTCIIFIVVLNISLTVRMFVWQMFIQRYLC